MSKVHKLDIVSRQVKRQDHLVEKLEEALELAKKGGLEGWALVIQTRTEIDGSCMFESRLELLGAIERLKWVIQEAVDVD